MSTEPLVSVIIAAHRAEATLPRAVRRLLAQTYPWWRAIVAADDGVDDLAVLTRAGICDDRLNLELPCAAPGMGVHPASLYLYRKRDGSITQAPDAAETAECGYAAILHLLENQALRLSKEVHAAAHAEFAANRRVDRLSRHHMSGRCASLEDFLDVTQNERGPWAEAELARLGEEPARAA
jgi:glycosyltransferase involved in cell wall biosynthesis